MPGPTRRSVLLGGAAFLAGPGRGRAAVPSISFGLTPVFLTNDRELLGMLRRQIEQETGAPVRLVLARTYQEITTMLLAGQLDGAWICGFPYVRHRDELALLAAPVWRGRQFYRSYLIVRDDDAAAGLDALGGGIHAFSDPDSNSGFLVTCSELARIGEVPERFFARSFFTYGHRNVVRAVASGLARSGSVDGYVWEALAASEPELVARTRVVWHSEWLGFPPVACPAAEAGAEGPRALAAALMRMGKSEPGRQVLSLLQLDGFAPADPSLFDGIAARMRSLPARG